MTRTQRQRQEDSARHLSPIEVATHWHVTEALVRALCRCGTLRAHRVGRKWRIAPEDMNRCEREQRVAE